MSAPAISEACPNCGDAVRVHYGPDIRFTPPCTKPMMYRAECSGQCLSPSWTAFTSASALEMWNEGVRRKADEASRIDADLAYNADKDAGGPARRNQERAMALQMKQPQTNEGFFA